MRSGELWESHPYAGNNPSPKCSMLCNGLCCGGGSDGLWQGARRAGCCIGPGTHGMLMVQGARAAPCHAGAKRCGWHRAGFWVLCQHLVTQAMGVPPAPPDSIVLKSGRLGECGGRQALGGAGAF